MKIAVDYEKCIGNGMCAALAPLYFELDTAGDLKVLQEDVADGDEEMAEEAEAGCPVGAIKLILGVTNGKTIG